MAKEKVKTEIERKEKITQYMLHIKGSKREVLVCEYYDIGAEKITAWEFHTMFEEPIKGPQGQAATFKCQCHEKIVDAKDFERAFEWFEKEADAKKKKARKEMELKMSGIIIPSQNNNTPNPLDFRGNNRFGKG